MEQLYKPFVSLCVLTTAITNGSDHRLNGSSSPVLPATSLSYGKSKNSTPDKIKTPNLIEIEFCIVDYVGEMTAYAKFYVNLHKGASRQIGEIYAKIFLRMCFFFQRTHRSDPLRDFYA